MRLLATGGQKCRFSCTQKIRTHVVDGKPGLLDNPRYIEFDAALCGTFGCDVRFHTEI